MLVSASALSVSGVSLSVMASSPRLISPNYLLLCLACQGLDLTRCFVISCEWGRSDPRRLWYSVPPAKGCRLATFPVGPQGWQAWAKRLAPALTRSEEH